MKRTAGAMSPRDTVEGPDDELYDLFTCHRDDSSYSYILLKHFLLLGPCTSKTHAPRTRYFPSLGHLLFESQPRVDNNVMQNPLTRTLGP